MVASLFKTPLITALEKTLDAATLRQRVIAHNLANLNTPGFKRLEVNFEENLARALGKDKKLPLVKTHPAHLTPELPLEKVAPEVERNEVTTARTDGNNVSLEAEMAKLLMNGVNYRLAGQLISGKLGSLRYVINEGRR